MCSNHEDLAPLAAGQTEPLAAISFRATSELGRVTLEVGGELDLSTAIAFERIACDLVDRGGQLRLDLSGVSFMDLAGLRALDRSMGVAGDWLQIEPSVQPQVRRLAAFTNTEAILLASGLAP